MNKCNNLVSKLTFDIFLNALCSNVICHGHFLRLFHVISAIVITHSALYYPTSLLQYMNECFVNANNEL